MKKNTINKKCQCLIVQLYLFHQLQNAQCLLAIFCAVAEKALEYSGMNLKCIAEYILNFGKLSYVSKGKFACGGLGFYMCSSLAAENEIDVFFFPFLGTLCVCPLFL